MMMKSRARFEAPYVLGAAVAAAWLLGVSAPAFAQDSAAPSPPATAPTAPTSAPAPSDAPAAAPTAPAEAAAVTPPPPPPPPPPAPLALVAAPDVSDYSEKALYDQPKNDVTTLNASGGGSLNTGNTRAYLLNAGADFRLVRNPHGVGATVAFAYGRTADPAVRDAKEAETIKNLNAKARYDFFITQMDAVFAATGFRWDPFAGINRRNQGQIGYLRYFVVEEKQRFWGEVGYDLTGDSFKQLPMAPALNPKTDLLHSARFFLGYDNHLNDAVTYLGGVEALINLTKSHHERINFDNALRSSLSDNFKLELKFRLAYDQSADERGAHKVDTITLVSLIYTLI